MPPRGVFNAAALLASLESGETPGRVAAMLSPQPKPAAESEEDSTEEEESGSEEEEDSGTEVSSEDEEGVVIPSTQFSMPPPPPPPGEKRKVPPAGVPHKALLTAGVMGALARVTASRAAAFEKDVGVTQLHASPVAMPAEDGNGSSGSGELTEQKPTSYLDKSKGVSHPVESKGISQPAQPKWTSKSEQSKGGQAIALIGCTELAGS